MRGAEDYPRRFRLQDGRVIGDGQVPYLIAEVNTSHFGKMSVAKEMIARVADAGFDCVKFQSWAPDSLYSAQFLANNSVQKRLLSQFAFSPSELLKLSHHAESVGIAFSSTPYSLEEAVWLVQQCKAPFVKIASMDVTYRAYLKQIAALGAPVVLSTGMADLPEIQRACDVFGTANAQLALLHCVSLYPTPTANANVRNIVGLRNVFPSAVVGFSDHTIGHTAAIASVTLGASIIEKHVTADASIIGMDNQMALDLERAGEFVQVCRDAALALGATDRSVSSAEDRQRRVMRRSLVATQGIPAGAKFSHSNIGAFRPGDGLSPEHLGHFLESRAARDISCGEQLAFGDAH